MLTLYFHPLSSYCWKALIGLYETETVFETVLVNLGDPVDRAAFQAVWPLGKFPVLKDEGRGAVVPESTIILDYIDQFHPGPSRLIPTDPDAAWKTRLADRIFDLHLHHHMQEIVADRLRPAGQKDPTGVAQHRAKLLAGYAEVERMLADQTWLSGGQFGLVECAALPALFYGDKVEAIGPEYPLTRAYLERLKARPSVARVLEEAAPYFQYFPAG